MYNRKYIRTTATAFFRGFLFSQFCIRYHEQFFPAHVQFNHFSVVVEIFCQIYGMRGRGGARVSFKRRKES